MSFTPRSNVISVVPSGTVQTNAAQIFSGHQTNHVANTNASTTFSAVASMYQPPPAFENITVVVPITNGASANAGVILPGNISPRDDGKVVRVVNASANAIIVYPPLGATVVSVTDAGGAHAKQDAAGTGTYQPNSGNASQTLAGVITSLNANVGATFAGHITGDFISVGPGRWELNKSA